MPKTSIIRLSEQDHPLRSGYRTYRLDAGFNPVEGGHSARLRFSSANLISLNSCQTGDLHDIAARLNQLLGLVQKLSGG